MRITQLPSTNWDITYDLIGNPKQYLNKFRCKWKGKQLITCKGINFEYDGLGRRVKKKNTSYYYDSSDRLIKSSDGMEYFYDHTGVAGFKYEEATYFYMKDVQGNITAILDSTGNIVVEYTYDAWGNNTVSGSNTTLGELNPFRYRGYFYDTETKLYYLKTRYYDPETGRFISMDSVEYADPTTYNGLNLYAYCGNNPVMNVDPTGTAFIAALLIGMLIGGVLAGAFNATVSAISGDSWQCVLGEFFGGFFSGAALAGAAILGAGFAVGALSVTAASVAGTAIYLTAGTFALGFTSYIAENGIKGEKLSEHMDQAAIRGGFTVLQGLFSFGVGYALGGAGLWDSLKAGNGFLDVIKANGLIKGVSSYLVKNAYPMIIGLFMRNIFTFPWNLIRA